MQGKTLVEQVERDGNIVIGKDTSRSWSGILKAIEKHFSDAYTSTIGNIHIVRGQYKGRKYAIRAKNVTYLGNPHPVFKKRIQIPGDLQRFYREAAAEGLTPILMGVYTHEDNELFCEFHIEDFIGKKANNSSAHVYTSDLAMAAVEGIFQKTDYFGNRITVFRPEMAAAFLDNLLFEGEEPEKPVELEEPVEPVEAAGLQRLSGQGYGAQEGLGMPEEILGVFQDFFASEPREWHGIDCYRKMMAADYRNKFQAEWAGFFLEYAFESYIHRHSLTGLVRYEQDKTKSGIDLDLYFPGIGCYGDLKAHSNNSPAIQGNDWDTVRTVLGREEGKNHIFYIVCEHSTVKDSERGYEVTEFWNSAQGKEDLMSYHKRMKNSVQLKGFYILDINPWNQKYLSTFRQGVNSNGKLRPPKIMIDRDNLSKFVIAKMALHPEKGGREVISAGREGSIAVERASEDRASGSRFRFIDLFSGIGGFHQAMEQLGGECVLASEIDESCNRTYLKNYGMCSDVNIRALDENTDVPDHEVLCAGFPCQAFSKAGKQEGMEDETRGTLFFDIVRILKAKHTKYIILENVRNLVSHDHGNTWKTIRKKLMECGYRLAREPLIVSPHQFGIPQLRERVLILGKYDPRNVEKPLNIQIEAEYSKDDNSIYSVLTEGRVEDKYYITEYETMVLNAWDEFYKGINRRIIGFPIWADYFRYEKAPEKYPLWKQEFVRKNIELYQDNREFIDGWFRKYDDLQGFIPTHHKMEWQAGTNIDSVWEGVIQMRPSGIRIKAPTCFPALVAMVQIPIIGRYKRRLTVEEAGRLQSFPSPVRDSEKMDHMHFLCDESDQQAYKQFGNSVNVEVIKHCARKLFEYKE